MAGGRPLILLDTCTLLWLAMTPEKLSPAARKTLADPATKVWISAVTGFEIGQKQASGKLQLTLEPAAWIERARRSHALDVLPLEMAVALRAAALPRLHNDPFDRPSNRHRPRTPLGPANTRPQNPNLSRPQNPVVASPNGLLKIDYNGRTRR
jgi:PIN domain nuclease of toxin-antitoxin system